MFRVILNIWLNLQINLSNVEDSDEQRHTVWIGIDGDLEGLKRLGILILKYEGKSVRVLLPLGWSTQSVTTQSIYFDTPIHQTYIINDQGKPLVELGATATENYEYNNFFEICS